MFQSSRSALALSLSRRVQRKDVIGKSYASFVCDELSATRAPLCLTTQQRHASSLKKKIRNGAHNHAQQKFNSGQHALQAVRKLIMNLDSSDERHIESQKRVYDGIEHILASIVSQVDEGSLNPSGKHGKELSRFFEFLLYGYSQVDIPGISSFDRSEEVLDTLQKWNLDIRSRHYEYAIISANRESRYKEASELFLRAIDPEAGYSPISVSLDTPHGLVAIALWAQEEGLPVAEHVFDAVMKLTMVSPSDQRQCKPKNL